MTASLHETLINLASHPLVFALARVARRVGPLWRVPGLGVLVSDAQLGREILQRDEDFTKNGPGSFAATMSATLGPVALGNMDGADHRRLRASLADLLAPARCAELVQAREADLARMIERLNGGETIDLVHFVTGWSGRIAFDFTGIAPPAGAEEAACHDIVRLSARLSTVLGFRSPSRRQAATARADCDRLEAYFVDGYEQPAAPLSLAQRLQSQGLSYAQARGLILLFVMAGTLTVRGGLPRIAALLLDHGLLPQLAQAPQAVTRAIEEGLRFTTPLPGTVRIVRQDTSLQGHTLKAGWRLVLLTGNMARDANVYSDPDRFDINRQIERRAGRPWFGAGPHHCAGLHLAQRELESVIGALAACAPDLYVVRRRASFGALLPGYATLMVRRREGARG